MDVMRMIFSDGLVLMTVGSAVISVMLTISCCAAGLCPCVEESKGVEVKRSRVEAGDGVQDPTSIPSAA